MVEYVGLDVSKEETSYCVVDEKGAVLARGKVSSDPDGIFAVLKEHCLCPEQIVLETGPQWRTEGRLFLLSGRVALLIRCYGIACRSAPNQRAGKGGQSGSYYFETALEPHRVRGLYLMRCG